MQEKIMVSVCCLAYNHEKYIRQCLEGFVRQKTNFKFEVIVHDDASTDNTAKIIREYEEKYPDIIKPIYQTENQYSKGIPIAKTFIHPKISGKYIAICEGDDYWCDNSKLQIQYDFLEGNPEYVACCHNTMFTQNDGQKSRVMYPNRTEDMDFTFELIAKDGYIYHTSSLMSKSDFFKKREEFGNTSFSDYPLALYLSLQGKIRYIHRIMSVYRFATASSWTRSILTNKSRQIKRYEEGIEMWEGVDRYTNGKYSEIIENAILRNRYAMEEAKGHYSVLRREPYKKIYKTNSFSYKLKLFIKRIIQLFQKANNEY